MNLEQLVERARAGDAGAMTSLIEATTPDLRRFARRVCRTGADAEDAVQHALVTLTVELRGLRHLTSFTAWAFTIVRNECARVVRVAQRWFDSSAASPEHEGPDEALERGQLLERIASAVRALPPPLREVFVLREFEGLDTATCAQRLEISPINVKVRLHRARLLLRDALVEET